tara:strand:+ start:266 stop:529 length:264 start_codon:yes stop_codon:yes gene_type:complete
MAFIKIRRGRHLKTIVEDNHYGHISSMEWTEFDDLDTKTIDSAENNYEKVFVVLREGLKDHGYDDEDARLSITQDLADLLRQNNLIR